MLYIPNDVKQNYPFFWLQLVVATFGPLTNQNLSSVFKQTNKKFFLKTLGTSVINSPMLPPSLHHMTVGGIMNLNRRNNNNNILISNRDGKPKSANQKLIMDFLINCLEIHQNK